MGESNTLLYVIAIFVLLHIVVGIGYLVYKISTAPDSTVEVEEARKEEVVESQD